MIENGKTRLMLFICCVHAVLTSSIQCDGNEGDDSCGNELSPERYFSKTPSEGFHVLSLKPGVDRLQITFFANGQANFVEFSTTEATFKQDVEAHFPKYPNVEYGNPLRQPWRVFTTDGYPLTNFEDIAERSLVFVMEGGQWVWPGVRNGFRQKVSGLHAGVSGIEHVWIETLSLRPLVFRIEGFLTDSECDQIQKHSEPHMESSGVSLMDKDKGKAATEWRTSSTYFLLSRKNRWINPIDDRVSKFSRVPLSHQEDVQVLRYGKTQKYDAHHDFFDKQYYQGSPGVLDMIQNGAANRMSTVFWYLSNVAAGGHTWFPRAFGSAYPSSFIKCSGGLKVEPLKGSAIIFYNLLPSGALDELSLHAGCPVEDGTKWSANKWIWSKPRS